jgi:cell division protein FtsL
MPNKPQKFSIPEDINDIDTKIADIEKQLADIKEKIDQKESSNRNRISL